jgi:hypothetical protein
MNPHDADLLHRASQPFDWKRGADREAFDFRNWLRRRPVFAMHIDLITVMPDETDVLELGPRVALAYPETEMLARPSQWIWKYRRG